MANLLAKFELCIYSRSRDIRGPKIRKVGHLTRATPFLANFSFLL